MMTTMRADPSALLLALALLLPGNAVAEEAAPDTPAPEQTRERSVHRARDYKKALRSWTRELKLYRDFETKLLMRALFRSRSFRETYSREYARRFMLPAEDYALLRERELDDGARFHEVLIAVWAADSKGGHLIGDDAPWQIRLVGPDGRSVAPLVLQRIKRPSTEVLELFPFITPHDRVFIAKFPVLGNDGTPLLTAGAALRLRVAGVLARGEMSWDAPR